MNPFLAAFLGTMLPVGIVLTAGVCLSFFYTKRSRRTVFHSPAEFGLAFEEVRFPASDGLALRGCWIPAGSGPAPAVIVMHGHGGSLDCDVHRAPAFHAAGFGVFLFDFRAHGLSRGHCASFGYLERRDVRGAVDFVKGRGATGIGLLGFSYGGIAAMVAAPLCPEVRAVATDGGPARMRTAIMGRCAEMRVPRPFAAFLARLILLATSVRLGVKPSSFEAVRWVGQVAPRPILFIHGEKDLYCADFDDLWTAAGEPKEAWRLPGVGHTKASEVYPDEFRERIVGFFARHLAEKPPEAGA